MDGNRDNKVKILAVGGLVTALSLVILYLACVVPRLDMTLYAAASLLMAVAMIESRGRAGWLVFAAVCIMGFFIVPDKIKLLPYGAFFGIYPILKSYMERCGSHFLEYFLKIFWAMASGFGCFLGLQAFIFPGAGRIVEDVTDIAAMAGYSSRAIPYVLLAIAVLAFFLIYDLLLTYLINWYYRRVYDR